MTRIKKIILVLLMAALVLAMSIVSVFASDEYYIEDNVIHITGDLNSITIDVKDIIGSTWCGDFNISEPLYVEPGDDGEYSFTLVNDTDHDYKVVDSSHTKYLHYLNEDSNQDWRVSTLGKYDPTVHWILNKYCDLNSNDVRGMSSREFNNYKEYITKENVLNYYKEMNNKNYSTLEEAWEDNFYSRCFSLNYSKPLIDMEMGDTVTVNFEVSGPNTDNMYQNSEFGWHDTITVAYEEKPQEPDNPTDNPGDKPSKDPKDKPNIDKKDTSNITPNEPITPVDYVHPKTGDENHIGIYIIILVMALAAIYFVKKLK